MLERLATVNKQAEVFEYYKYIMHQEKPVAKNRQG